MDNRLDNGMINWLDIVDNVGGVTSWIIQRRDFPTRSGRRGKSKNSDEIIEMVLNSKAIQNIIREECIKRNTTSECLYSDARQTLSFMAHKLQLSTVRFVGFFVANVIKTIYDGVYFNDSQLLQIRERCKEDPVIFLPTHRSYMDFLIVSILCFDHNVPLPVIASGMDFMTSVILGETLRRCGSFFMKRKFGKDNLYWSLFKSYLQMQLLEADNTIEFFLEGTRSRSGKSLSPKCGLLQMCIELFLSNQLYDLTIVPVTIVYDKVLEEMLYAYEVFGFSKPKETTTGLFKSLEILGKRYGNIYVNFGEPISVRNYFDGKISRVHAPWQQQLSVNNKLSDEEKEVVRNFAYHIIDVQKSNSVVTVWPYACALILAINEGHRKMAFSVLLSSLNFLITLSATIGRQCMLRKSVVDDLRYHLKLHSNLFTSNHDYMSDDSEIEIRRFECLEDADCKKRDYMEEMMGEVILTHYANQMMHDFADISLLCHVLLYNRGLAMVHQLFRELRCLFIFEFVCLSEIEKINSLCSQSLEDLVKIDAIVMDDHQVILKEETILVRLALLMQPYIVKYYCVIYSLEELADTKFTYKILLDKAIRVAIDLRSKHSSGNWPRTVCVTSDMVQNALSALCAQKVVNKYNETEYEVDISRLQLMRNFLENISVLKMEFDSSLLLSKL